jgi:hypothetical protein
MQEPKEPKMPLVQQMMDVNMPSNTGFQGSGRAQPQGMIY